MRWLTEEGRRCPPAEDREACQGAPTSSDEGGSGASGYSSALLAMGCGGQGGTPVGPAGGTSTCVGTTVVTPKRVVRFSEHQLWSSYTALFGASAAAIITRNEDPPSLLEREFPPISGDIGVSEGLFAESDRLAQSAMDYVSENAVTLAPCGAVPSDKGCVQEYLLSFAERAFRHPLSDEEQIAITGQFWTEMTAAGATLTEALAYGVYGILSSPSFLYRTELGADAAVRRAAHAVRAGDARFRCSSPTPSRRGASRRRGLQRAPHARPDPRPGDPTPRGAGGARQPRERAHQVLLAHQGADGGPEPGGDAGAHRDRRHAGVDLP